MTNDIHSDTCRGHDMARIDELLRELGELTINELCVHLSRGVRYVHNLINECPTLQFYPPYPKCNVGSRVVRTQCEECEEWLDGNADGANLCCKCG